MSDGFEPEDGRAQLERDLSDARHQCEVVRRELAEERRQHVESRRELSMALAEHLEARRERDEARAEAKERSEFAAAETGHANRWAERAHAAEKRCAQLGDEAELAQHERDEERAEVERLRGELRTVAERQREFCKATCLKPKYAITGGKDSLAGAFNAGCDAAAEKVGTARLVIEEGAQ